MKLTIKLNTVSDIKEFIQSCTLFTSDINLTKGTYCVDAKSIMGVFSIDCSTGVVVEIITEDKREIDTFVEAMAKYQ